MKFRGKILNLEKEEVGKIQEEIESKNNDIIQKKKLTKDYKEKTKSQKSVNPIISIITPYYNGQDYIDETAQSVLNQTFTNFEWIIVDDASSKQGKEKLKEIEKLDDRIKVIETGGIKNEIVLNEEDIDECKNPPSQNSQSKNSLGPAGARDLGIRNSAKSSKYIVFLDADDLYDKTYLECCYWTLETHPEASWTYTDSVNFGAKNFLWRKWYDVEWELKENILLVSACIRKKDLFEVGCFGIKEKKVYEDWYLWVKLIKAGKFPVRMSSLLTYYRQKKDSSELKASNESNRKRALKIIEDAKRDIVYYKDGVQFPKYDYSWEEIEDEPRISEMQVLTKNSNPNISRKAKNKKINILMIFPWMVTGGADRFNLNLVKKMDKRNFSFTIVTTLPNSNEWRRQFEKYATVYDLTSFLDMKDWTSFINYIINKNNINLIFNSNSEFGYKVLPYLKAKHSKIPICDFVHMEEWYIRNGGFSRDSSSVQNVIDKTFTCNENSRNVFINYFKRKPEEIKTMYIGVDEKKFDPEKFNRKDLINKFKYGDNLKNKIIISYVCRIADQKRPYLFFEVIKKLTEIRDDFVAIVAGDGPMLEGLKRKVKQQRLEKYFVFARKYKKNGKNICNK